MQCPRCQHDNREGRRFCAMCGAALAAACPSCGFTNESGDEFCGGCGACLGAPQPAQGKFTSPDTYTPRHLAEKILTSKAALEGERKQVTVLFADLKGSMELLADRDPEEARRLLDPVLERMMEAVHRYEGTVNQVMGDGIMALFGAPLAHEDHAVRACYAALRMRDLVKRYAEDARRAHGVNVQIRVGLNSGEVVVRAIGGDLHMDYTAVGQTTHLAARMEQFASPGSILVTAATLELVEGLIAVKPLGPVPVKGLTEPVEVYEVTGTGAVRTRLRASAARGLTRLVGRDSELDQLRQALERAGRGHGQIVAVVGEPGVGKSRLFWEFTRSPGVQGCLVLEGESVSYGRVTPYFPIINLLKRYFQIDERDDQDRIREKVTAKLAMRDAALAQRAPTFLELLGLPEGDADAAMLDPPRRRQRTLEVVNRLLLQESQVQPLLLVFEDLHWIDSETRALLDRLVDSVPTARILLLLNYRPEYHHGWDSETHYTQLRLDPLSPEIAEELLQTLLGDNAALRPLKRLLIEQTEGNPFFLEESIQALIEAHSLVGARGAYRLGKDVSAIHVAPTVQALLAARIDRLPSEEKGLLQSAAVIGRNIPFALLQATSELPDENLRDALAHLQAGEFLYETSLFLDLAYTFKHALTQEVAYGSLLQSTRQHHHRRIAHALVERFPETAQTQPELVAHHYTAAGQSDRAVIYWQRAGQRASHRAAYVEATNHLRKGLELLETLPVSSERMKLELELQSSLGPVLMATRGYAAPELEIAYARARELSQQFGETPQLYPILWGLWAFYLVRADLTTARELAEQLLRVAESAADSALLVEAHYAIADTLFWLGELSDARTHFEQAISGYDLHEHRSLALRYGEDPKVTSLSYLSWTLWNLGYADQARRVSQEAVALATQLSHPPSMAFAFFLAARLHVLLRNPSGVKSWTDKLVAIGENFAFWAALGTMWQGWILAEQGKGQDGISLMRQGLIAYKATGARLPLAAWSAMIAEACSFAERAEEGLQLSEEALEYARDTGEVSYEAEAYRLKGEFLLAIDPKNHSEVEACFQQALSITRRQNAKALQLRAAMSLGRLWQQQGRHEDARAILAEIHSWFTEGFDTADLRALDTALEHP